MGVPWIIGTSIFAIGCSVGSFILLITERIHLRVPWAFSRSECRSCGATLAKKDLIPVVSYGVLRGACRNCHTKIHWKHPLVELMMGGMFLAAFFVHGLSIDAGRAMLVFAVLLALFLSDSSWMELPDSITIPSILILGVFQSITRTMTGREMLIGAGIGGGFFLVQYLASKGRWIGDGDIRLGVFLGTAFGVAGVIAILFFSYIFGAMLAIYFLLSKKKKSGDQLPFGAILCGVAVWFVLWGDSIIEICSRAIRLS